MHEATGRENTFILLQRVSLKFSGRFWLALDCRHHLLLALVISLNPFSPPIAASLCQSILNLTFSIPPLSAPKMAALRASPCQVFLKRILSWFLSIPKRLSSHFAAVKSNQGGKQSQFLVPSGLLLIHYSESHDFELQTQPQPVIMKSLRSECVLAYSSISTLSDSKDRSNYSSTKCNCIGPQHI